MHSPQPPPSRRVRAEPERWGRSPAGRLGPFSPARPAGAWPRSAHRAGRRRRPQVEAVELALAQEELGQIAHAVRRPSSSSNDVSASSSISSASMPPRACAAAAVAGPGLPVRSCGPEGLLGRRGHAWRVLGTTSPRAASARCRRRRWRNKEGAGRWATARRPRKRRSPVEAAAELAGAPAAATRCPGLGSVRLQRPERVGGGRGGRGDGNLGTRL